MIVKFIEVTNAEGGGGINWGKFMLARFTHEEWAYRSEIDGASLIAGRGWTPAHVLVTDLQTGEGAIFRPGGLAAADLQKHRIWVCPMFDPFLVWLYKQDLTDLAKLPAIVRFSEEDAPSSIAGYRRPGPKK